MSVRHENGVCVCVCVCVYSSYCACLCVNFPQIAACERVSHVISVID